jgi:hypothetical protein
MRCLYCGKHLALFKKLTGGGEFCSDAHKQSYHEEYNKLALNRLIEAQTRQEDPGAGQPVAGASPPSAPEMPAMAEPTARGGYIKQPVTVQNPAGVAVLASLAQEPAARPIGLPATEELRFAPEPAQAGVMMEHRGVSIPVAVMATAPGFLRTGLDSVCVFPEHRAEIEVTMAPGAAGPVACDAGPTQPPEPALKCESPAGFRFSWTLPEAMEPDWAGGLEFAASEESLTAMARGGGVSAAAEDTEASGAPEPELPTETEPDEPAAAGPNPLLVSVLASATAEPVIDDALLFSLFGRDDEAPAPDPQPGIGEPAAGPTPAPAKVVADAAGSAPHEPAPGPTPAPAKVVAAAAGAAPHEPGSFLPVAIRPAGPPNRTRLMQSFQAISMVSANPQLPTWNMLPLRPRMSLGRAPGPGAGMVDRGAASEARKGTVEVAHGPQPSEDTAVPTFGAATKPRGGLSRWFKLSILAGVLGIAGGMFHPAGVGGAVAGERQDMTTEFAVCRN